MSTTTFQTTLSPDDATAAVMSDPTGAFGVRRTDTNAVLVAAGAAADHPSTTFYQKTITDPAAGIPYEAWFKLTVGTDTIYRRVLKMSGGAESDTLSYLTVTKLRALLARMPAAMFPRLSAGSDAAVLAGAVQASIDIDAAGPWQGRKYQIAWGTTAEQVLEFPRVAYDDGAAWPWGYPLPTTPTPGGGVVVWDWDVVNRVAVVPAKVEEACLYQSEDVLAGSRAKRIQAIADGLASVATGSLSESYRTALAASGGVPGILCLRAEQIMKQYRLKQGRIL
jgi:hypothetical protein